MSNPDINWISEIVFQTLGDPSAGIEGEHLTLSGLHLEEEDATTLGELLREELSDFFDDDVISIYYNSEGYETEVERP